MRISISELIPGGFRWGPMEVQRCCSDRRYHTLAVRTAHEELQIHVSPTGRSVRVVRLKRSALIGND